MGDAFMLGHTAIQKTLFIWLNGRILGQTGAFQQRAGECGARGNRWRRELEVRTSSPPFARPVLEKLVASGDIGDRLSEWVATLSQNGFMRFACNWNQMGPTNSAEKAFISNLHTVLCGQAFGYLSNVGSNQ